MQGVIRLFDGLFRFFGRLIFTPILLGWMIGAVLFGAMLGFVIGGVVAISAFGPPLGQSAWEWAIIAPPVFIGGVFGFQYWRKTSGADAYFGLTGDSHGSARFANRKELKKLEGRKGQQDAGLLIGRNPHTGRLLRYDGPAHLITLAPTRAGKGVGTVGPTLFLLDEFAALGRLEAVERAMGLMAGYGLQLWPILQDMSQLKDLYRERAGTFIANAGVQQVFGVNDFETAKWLSQMIGQETTGFQTDSYKPGDNPSFSNNLTGRDLLTPDEIMQMPPDLQLLRVQGQPSALAQKLRYYAEPEFRGLFVPQDQ